MQVAAGILRNQNAVLFKSVTSAFCFDVGVFCVFFWGGAETPLTLAVQTEQASAEGIRLLVMGGAHIDFRAKDGLTPMHKAVRNHNHAGLLVTTSEPPVYYCFQLDGALSLLGLSAGFCIQRCIYCSFSFLPIVINIELISAISILALLCVYGITSHPGFT